MTRDLFDTLPLHPPPYQRGSATSSAAAAEIEPKVNRLRRQVLDYLRIVGEAGATDEEIQRWCNMQGNTERPRRKELVRDGLVVDSGTTRKTESGRQAVVWRVA